MNINSESDYTESAYGASSDSGSSEERRKSRERKNKKAKKSKSHGKKKKEKDKDDKPKKNTCPLCKKYHRKKSHCVEPDKCMWNKKYKGCRFKSICNELKVDFKPRIKFTADLSGYAEKEDSWSKWRCTGTSKEGKNKDDKWVTVTGSGKTKKLLKPKLKPTLHNAFAILFQPDNPTSYNMSGPPLQMDNNKTIMPPDPWEHCRQR